MTHAYQSGTIHRHFVEGLAYRPRSGREKDFAMPRPAEAAVKLRYLSPDQPYKVLWLKIDIDHKGADRKPRQEHAAVAWLDAGAPPPHFTVCHPNDSNLGAHMLYGLLVPVGFAPKSRIAPQLLFQLVSHGMTKLLGGDGSYSGQTIKNPLHPHWHTITQDIPLYTLADLLDCLPETLRRRPLREEMVGEGRNTDLFYHLRQWAYSEVYAAWRDGHSDLWTTAVLRQAHDFNRYDVPLARSEVAKTAASVARWTWKNAGNFEQRGTEIRDRSKIYSALRPTLTEQQARDRMSEGGALGGVIGAPITHAIQRNRTFDAVTGAIATLAGQGFQNPSVAQISRISGLSESTVHRFRRQKGTDTSKTN